MPIARSIEALRRGETDPLRAYLQSDAVLSIDEWREAWYRVSTLTGGLDCVPCESRGETRSEWPLSRSDFNATGGPPRRLENLEALRSELVGALRTPLSRSRHRRRLLRSMQSVLVGESTGVPALCVVALARHHTELAVDQLSGWKQQLACWHPRSGWAESYGAIVRSNRALFDWLAASLTEAARFDKLIEDGLRSPSPPRRELCATLYLLEES